MWPAGHAAVSLAAVGGPRMSEDAAGYVKEYMTESVSVMTAFGADAAAQATLLRMANATVASMRAGGKLLVAGNGGSAADAQHIAGEFISRLMFYHAPLPAIALTTDSSATTA